MSFASKYLAAFYYQFGTMIQSGVPIQRALTMLQTSAPSLMRPTVATLRKAVDHGQPFHEAVAQHSDRFSVLDQHTLSVSEQSGSLDVGLLSLSKYHDSRARARSRIASACTFPALLLVAAVFIGRAPAWIVSAVGSGEYSMLDYLRDTVGLLALLALGGFLVSRLVRLLLNAPGINVAVEKLLRPIPVIGPLRFHYALSQWLSSIRLLLNAGFGVVQAMENASRMVPSPLIARAYEKARPLVGGQLEVSQALQSTGVFPEQLIQFWATGEESGRLDEMLDRLARHYEEEWQLSLERLAAWLPRIAYGVVCLFILLQIVHLLGPLIGAYAEALH